MDRKKPCKKIRYDSKKQATVCFQKHSDKKCYAYQCVNCFPFWHITTTTKYHMALHARFVRKIRRGDALFVRRKSKTISDWKLKDSSQLYHVRYYEKLKKVKILSSALERAL